MFSAIPGNWRSGSPEADCGCLVVAVVLTVAIVTAFIGFALYVVP